MAKTVAPIPDDAVLIVDRSQAGKILCSPRRRSPFGFLVSIGAPTERPPAGIGNIARRLRLIFEDALSEREGGPSQGDILRLVRFGQTVDLAQGRVLVHCQAGVSRSAAAAIILLATMWGPGHETAAIEHVHRTHPHVNPNRRMLELADALLAAEGRLLGDARATR